MATLKFSAPNWCQGLIIRAVGLDPSNTAIRQEDSDSIVVLEHKTRKEYIINKATGKVLEA